MHINKRQAKQLFIEHAEIYPLIKIRFSIGML